MASKDFGIRDGEKAVDLPSKPDAGLYFIGRIHTPWKERKDCPKNARESEAVCVVELDPRWHEGLKDVETCTHLVLLYWMDKSPRDLVLQVPGHYGVQHGTFALPLAVPAKSSRDERGQTPPRGWQPAFGDRPRLPGRHTAARYQAVFCLNR